MPRRTESAADDGDRLNRLWTPYRMAYVTGEKPTGKPGDSDRPAGPGHQDGTNCPFCLAPKLSDDEGLVVAKGRKVYALLNRYPYNTGHLMICPYRHVPDFTDLDEAETEEFARFGQIAMRVMRAVSKPAGFNLGMNQGSVGGAGIAGHLHLHVVPRWAGDTNFMPVIALTKVLPQLLADTRRLLAEGWAEIAPVKVPARGRAPRSASPKSASSKSASSRSTPAKPKPTEPKPAAKSAAKAAPAARATRRRSAA